MLSTSFFALFLVGLLGGTHCVGMCGGIVGALTLGLPLARERPLLARLPFLLAYNTGRIASYVTAGALAGGVTRSLALDAHGKTIGAHLLDLPIGEAEPA